MDDKTIHELAAAYAQAKLIKEQSRTEYNLDSTNKEIRDFIRSYRFALVHIPEEDDEIDISTLC